ncbi:MAG TPA: hypothetical protein VJ953_22465 [Saprospiraceae bacterium]|nr:hypothetical protein [Saprospiraceae bacterium]
MKKVLLLSILCVLTFANPLWPQSGSKSFQTKFAKTIIQKKFKSSDQEYHKYLHEILPEIKAGSNTAYGISFSDVLDTGVHGEDN